MPVGALSGNISVGLRLSTKFWVEPLQLLAVAWFISIAVFAPERDGLHTLLHLMAASSFAMLVKVSSPLYCLGPGLAALVLIFSFQFLAASLQAFGIIAKDTLFEEADMYTLKIWPPDIQGEQFQEVEEIIDIVCPKSRRWQGNVVGFGRPVATEQVLDFYALNRLAPDNTGCRFTYILNFLWGAPPGDPAAFPMPTRIASPFPFPLSR